jgi:hypothetical protein
MPQFYEDMIAGLISAKVTDFDSHEDFMAAAEAFAALNYYENAYLAYKGKKDFFLSHNGVGFPPMPGLPVGEGEEIAEVYYATVHSWKEGEGTYDEHSIY